MKRRDLIRRIAIAARQRDLDWDLVREGGNHSVYELDGLVIPIARHRELLDRYAIEVFKECAPKLGAKWWEAE